MPQLPKKIPVYKADGRLEGRFTRGAVDRLLSVSRAVVRRDRRGAITCAHLRPLDGANPLRATANMGQRYSFQEPVGSGRRAWSHKSLMQRQDLEALLGIKLDSAKDVDLYIRGVFRAVPLSVMRTTPPSPNGPAKVVSISTGRRNLDARKRAA